MISFESIFFFFHLCPISQHRLGTSYMQMNVMKSPLWNVLTSACQNFINSVIYWSINTKYFQLYLGVELLSISYLHILICYDASLVIEGRDTMLLSLKDVLVFLKELTYSFSLLFACWSMLHIKLA